MINSKDSENKKLHLCFSRLFHFAGHSWDFTRSLSDLIGRFFIFDLKKIIYKKNEREGLGSYHFYEESLISLRKVGTLFLLTFLGLMIALFGLETLIIFSLPIISLVCYLVFFHFKLILRIGAYIIFFVFFLFHKEKDRE